MDSNLLERYYAERFPASQLCSWLNNGQDNRSKDTVIEDIFEKREFSYTLPGDIYCRHKSYRNAEELRKELVDKKPEKIDVGAVWSFPPRLKNSLSNSGRYEPLEKEFVIDIDMNDYDNVRTCCSGAVVCPRCWKFLVVACKSVEFALKNSFGFKLSLWVYSGRRGIHCWVSDFTAKKLNDYRRKSLIDFLNSGPKSHTPFIQIYENILKRWFTEIIVEDQNLFASSKHVATLIELYGENIFNYLKEYQPDKVWEAFKKICKENQKEEVIMKAMFKFLYPRLDANVSTATNHLLKSPFSVHPSTKKVCIPFDPKYIENFNLTTVPDLENLFDEDYEFNKAVKYFEGHIRLIKQSTAKERGILAGSIREESEMDFD
jgi:DNA primase small subunit